MWSSRRNILEVSQYSYCFFNQECFTQYKPFFKQTAFKRFISIHGKPCGNVSGKWQAWIERNLLWELVPKKFAAVYGKGIYTHGTLVQRKFIVFSQSHRSSQILMSNCFPLNWVINGNKMLALDRRWSIIWSGSNLVCFSNFIFIFLISRS